MTTAERLSSALADRYRIERELGQGGMATVYLAEDLKHKRKVALKVLKPELAAVLGADRFVQEITTTASLQHPHILPLFDSGTADGFLYYVMPFIEGETLRDKLNRETQLGVDEAVRIAREVADALDYAHGKGIIHRDIKPENILIQNGRPMVADFGIALAVSAAAGGRMTETGLSLGTPHYMSPEQATADKEISARSDVYSLATVLYEMLAGQPPHLGGSAQQIIMKIIAEQPQAVTALRKSVPPNVSASLAKALEKLPADRFESARAFAAALADPSFASTRTGTGFPAQPNRTHWKSRIAIPALASVVVLLAALGWLVTRPAPPLPVARFEVATSDGMGDYANLAVSPDGNWIASVVRGQLHVRRRDQLDGAAIMGTEGAQNPAFSPDGQRIAFKAGGVIKTVGLSGALPAVVTDSAVGVPGLAWGTDGYLYYDRRGNGPLLRIRDTGGVPETVSALDTTTHELQHVWPDPLPNGRGVVMVINRGGPGQGASVTDGIAVLDLRTGRHRELFRGVFVKYASSGHLLYVTREGHLFGVPFDQDRLEVTGPSIELADGLWVRTTGTGAVDLAITREGTLWYSAGGQGRQDREVLWASRDGRLTSVDPPISGEVASAVVSPDGNQIAMVVRGSDGGHVWVTRLSGPGQIRVTFEKSFDRVAWHPDGRTLLATAPPGEVYGVPADGSALPRRLNVSARNVVDAAWTSDGAAVLYSGSAQRNSAIFEVRPAIDSTPKMLFDDEGQEWNPTASPDGKWVAYQSSRVSPGVVMVRPYPETSGSLRQVSVPFGREPRWSRDGREIFYRTFLGDSLVAVAVQVGTTISFGAPRALFPLQGVTAWDVTPGSQRFLLVRQRDAGVPKRLIVVQNFHEELRTRLTPSR